MSRVKLALVCSAMLQDVIYSERGNLLVAAQNCGDQQAAENIVRAYYGKSVPEDHIQGMLNILFYNPQKL